MAHKKAGGSSRNGRDTAGRRLGVMILSSDRDYTIRPAPGTELTMALADSHVRLPIVGGPSALSEALGE